jgi:MinD-like ATPase involved in chromosome partitioning or flagellar assembly
MVKTKVFGIISIKGGTGKTSLVSNLGTALAEEFNKKILMVDANFSAPNLGLHFGLADPEVTIHDVLMNKVNPAGAIYEVTKNLHLMPASLTGRRVNPFALKEIIGKLRKSYDVILIDSSPNLNEEILATMIASDKLFVVTNPDYPTLSTTLRAVKIAKQKNTPIAGLIINKSRNKKFELSLEEIEKVAEVPVISVIRDDVKIQEGLANHTPIVIYKGNSSSSVEIKKLAAALINEKYNDPRFFSGLRNIFSRNMKKEEVNREILKNN